MQIKYRIGKILPLFVKNRLNFIYSYFMERTEASRLKKEYSHFIKRGDLVFDIGANKGEHSKIFLDMGCRVVAVEPNPEMIKILSKKFGKKIKIIEKGMGSKEGNLQLNLYNETGHSTFLKESPKVVQTHFKNKINVEIITLNSLIKEEGIPKLIKIDVEGFEYEVLSTLNTPVKIIIFEFTPELMETSIKCINHLSKVENYKFNYSPEISHRTVFKNPVSANELLCELKKIKKKSFGDIHAILQKSKVFKTLTDPNLE